MKPYKVSVKHYLNTTLKPTIVNNKLHYPIYLMVNAHQKTMRLKSLKFVSNITEKEFGDLNKNKEYGILVGAEITAIERIARLVISELTEMNTTFFSAYANFCNDVEILNIDNLKEIQIYGFSLWGFCIQVLGETPPNKFMLFDFYNNKNQQKAKEVISKEIVKSNIKNVSSLEILEDINRLFFYLNMKYFNFYLKGNKKTRHLANKYNDILKEYLFYEKINSKITINN